MDNDLGDDQNMFQEFNFEFLNDPSYDLELTEIAFKNGNFETPVKQINKDLFKFKNKFKAAQINARSLPKNIVELREVIVKTHFDTVAVSETRLTKHTPSDRSNIHNFNLFRSDRKNKRGGGVAIFLRNHYNAKVIKTPCDKEIPEMLWLEVTIAKKKVALGVLYKPPKIPYSVFINLYECLVGIYAKYPDTILMGDFNINFENLEAPGTKFLIENFIEPFSLKQTIEQPTRITDIPLVL